MSNPSFEAEIAAARAYEALFVPALFGQRASRVVDAVNLVTGQRVLDVAYGIRHMLGPGWYSDHVLLK